ncbi:MAG TPA: hypothetical protein VJY62_13175 [Bacteroidia bacterium]|nr:hypothetical protein [Bacteroidia bacterium]
MKNYTLKGLKKLFFSLFLLLFISINSYAQGQKNQGSATPTVQVETMIVKVPGVKSDEVFLKYKNLLAGLKGVSIAGRTLKNEYLLIEVDKKQHQVIDVLQPMKDTGYFFDFLYDNPSPQKIQELFANDPLVN